MKKRRKKLGAEREHSDGNRERAVLCRVTTQFKAASRKHWHGKKCQNLHDRFCVLKNITIDNLKTWKTLYFSPIIPEVLIAVRLVILNLAAIIKPNCGTTRTSFESRPSR
jgi:hypothetical protein